MRKISFCNCDIFETRSKNECIAVIRDKPDYIDKTGSCLLDIFLNRQKRCPPLPVDHGLPMIINLFGLSI